MDQVIHFLMLPHSAHSSNQHTFAHGVPQGSVLGPFCSFFTTPPHSANSLPHPLVNHHLDDDYAQLLTYIFPHSLPDALNICRHKPSPRYSILDRLPTCYA